MSRRNHRPKTRQRRRDDPVLLELMRRIEALEDQLAVRHKVFAGVVIQQAAKTEAFPRTAVTWRGEGVGKT